MAGRSDATIPATRRARQSLGAHSDVRKTMDKENATTDVGSTLAAARNKSRSKSMGPGGLDALQQASGNRRASLAAPSKPPRSILKPTISALPEIPPLKRKSSSISSANNSKIISKSPSSPRKSDGSGSKVAVRTEEEQQAAAREREELERRDARRKSLANRRVSFAAEATLHTFHDLDYLQDSTSSTDSSRRTSSAAGKSPAPDSRNNTNQNVIQGSQNHIHHDNRRRSSGAQSMSYQNADDDTVTSVLHSDDSEPADMVEEVADVEDDGSSNDSDDGTMISIDTEEVTSTSMGSDGSVISTDESSTLDEALRLAAQRAGNQRQDPDEESDDGEEVIPSFGWVKKNTSNASSGQDQENDTVQSSNGRRAMDDETTTANMDMEVTNVVGGIIRPNDSDVSNPDEDMSMDVTVAYGGILPQNKTQQLIPQKRNDDTGDFDQSMDLTAVGGGIQQPPSTAASEIGNDEDMSMEMTAVLGGVLGQRKADAAAETRRLTINTKPQASGDDATMDMTVGMGRIISSLQSQGPADDESTLGMDITTTIGGILQNEDSGPKDLGKRIMEESNKPVAPEQAARAAIEQGSPSRRASARGGASPRKSTSGLSAFQGKGLRRSTGPQTHSPASSSPFKTLAEDSTPQAKPSTPQNKSTSTQRVTRSGQTSTPQRTSPRKSAVAKVTKTPSPRKSTSARASVFHEDPKTGNRTPAFVLTPQQRKLTGIGADRGGIGSPKVAELCDRRGSIGDAASDFVPGKRTVAFEDPKILAEEVDRERRNEDEKENKRSILEREADGSQEDATLNLRDMIDSMSPKRNPLHGRKSLHVGSASGILGKRPIELDSDEEEEENDGVKRLKGRQSSPVKNVRLQHPPTVEETTGRIFRSSQRPSAHPMSSPIKQNTAVTPDAKGKFKDMKQNATVHEVNFHHSPVKDAAELESEIDDGRIHLQDFLNMTSIRFMELTTTKRRHTTAPGTLQDGTTADGQDDLSLERCVVAGACTVPMLELYQHSCRELKKYIAEGRGMVREIEAETFEENPPLFREYMAATTEVKALMDHQFKNVKTHARLLSKAMWYEWRMKLQEGLKEGLVKIGEGMHADDKALKKQQELLESILPVVKERYDALTEENSNLQEVAAELADCDPAELDKARDELLSVTDDIEQKKKLIAELRQELEVTEQEAQELNEQKQGYLSDIKESEKIREECRGWTSTEVNTLKARVDAIEAKHGWAVTGISGTNLSMTYRREIELVFDIASFQPHQPNSRIDLWYIADSRDADPIPKTAEKEFFLQCIRDHVRAFPQSRTKVSQILEIVQKGWDKANLASAQIHHVNVAFPTTVSKTSDSSVAVTTSLLLVPLQSRVEVVLNLNSCGGQDGVDVSISPDAKVVYGEHFNVSKVSEFLATRVGKNIGAAGSEWSDVMVELQAKLIARGRKGELASKVAQKMLMN